MAIDSRQTYPGRIGVRIGSDSAAKIFELMDGILGMTSGYAFLRPQGSPVLRNISSLVEDFKVDLPPNLIVRQAAESLHRYFSLLYNEHILQTPQDALPAGNFAITFLVAGYDPQSRTGNIFECSIPGNVNLCLTTDTPSTRWIGQWDVVARIVRGWDPGVINLPSAQQAGPNFQQQLMGLEYAINWHTMTLQDAIDFAKLMIEITTTIQRFADGTLANPGGVPGVGGPIDIALLLPNRKISWIQRKQLHA